MLPRVAELLPTHGNSQPLISYGQFPFVAVLPGKMDVHMSAPR
jgi:hypothetical protein